MSRQTLHHLNAQSDADFTASLANVFEHSPWIAQAIAARRPFASLASLFHAMTSALAEAPDDRRLALIRAHPDLADKAQRAAGLTAESTAEQTGLGIDQLTDEEFEAFTSANAAYRDKFGFPFIVCVRRQTRDSVLADFARRQAHSIAQETQAAIDEICRIAALRLDELVDAPDRLPVTGRLSTHVLDTTCGKPAEGVAIELRELSELGHSRVIARTLTNADGRTDAPLISNRPLPIGRYELTFDVGDYFARNGVATSSPPFLDRIPLRFSIAEPEGHLHVPLLVTPWSYGTYRGS